MRQAVENFRKTLPPEDSELIICDGVSPCGCSDEKWYGVTVPKRKESEPVERQPQMFSLLTAPQHHTIFEDGDFHRIPTKHGVAMELKPPTAKELERHARMFGVKNGKIVPETLISVREVADMYGIAISIAKPPAAKRGPRKASRKEQAQQLLDLGHDWRVIENQLDLTRHQSLELADELGVAV